MSNFEQAPVLLKIGTKERRGLFTYRPQELEYALCCCLGDRDMVPLKTMLFFTGNANDGSFRVAQKTIFDRMNISEKRYYEARKKLQRMGWIQYVEAENAIYVNYDKIYADYREYLKEKNQAGGSDDSPNPFSIHDSPVVKEEPDQALDELMEYFDDSPPSSYQDRYNNIKNNKSNTIKNKKSSGTGAAVAALPQEEFIKQMKEDDKKVYEWAQIELQRINDIYNNPIEPSEIERMHKSEEYKQYLKALDKKREPLREKYGKLYQW